MHTNSLNKIHLMGISTDLYFNDNSESDTFVHLQSVCLVYLPPKNLIWVHRGEFRSLESSVLQLNFN